MGSYLSDYYSSPLNPLLRDPAIGTARSAYEVERNPWARRGDIEAALLFRGTIVSAYGYIESRLGELAIRCSRIPIYAAKRSSFPYSIDRRISFLRAAFHTGPLAPHQRFAEMFFDRVERTGALRHRVAHARMQVLPDWGITFHDIPRADAGAVMLRSHRMTMQELERSAWQAARLSRLCQHLLDRLDELEILPSI